MERRLLWALSEGQDIGVSATHRTVDGTDRPSHVSHGHRKHLVVGGQVYRQLEIFPGLGGPIDQQKQIALGASK